MNEGRIDPPTPPTGLGHVAALDGLRGLAVLAVMLFHQTVMSPATALDRQYVRLAGHLGCGVDLFFVLSGFLITGILYDSRESPRYYRNFYARRFLRIIPLYYAVLFVALVVLPWLPHARLEKWGHVHGFGQVWYWLFLSNWSIAFGGVGMRHGMIDLSWSLSIEEQFYLTWPILVRALDRRTLMRVCGALAVGSLAVRTGLLAAGAPPLWALLLTPARMDALAVGALVALAARGEGGLAGLVPLARRAGIIAGVVAAAIYLPPLPARAAEFLGLTAGLSSLAVLFGSILVVAVAGGREGPLARGLSGRFLTTLGAYSYALYLFHNPIQAATRDLVYGPAGFATWFGSRLPGQALFYALATAPALGCAWLSWRLYEAPWLRFKRYFPASGGVRPTPAFGPPPPAVKTPDLIRQGAERLSHDG